MKLWCVFDLASKKQEIDNLEAESLAEDFWSDNRKAQAHMQRLNALREEVSTWEGLATQLDDLHGLAGLLEEEPDEEMQVEVAQSLAQSEREIEKLQFSLMLSGEHDEKNAIISIHAGSGGVDAADWASMLLRMYLRWAEDHKFRTEIYDYNEGERRSHYRSTSSSFWGPSTGTSGSFSSTRTSTSSGYTPQTLDRCGSVCFYVTKPGATGKSGCSCLSDSTCERKVEFCADVDASMWRIDS